MPDNNKTTGTTSTSSPGMDDILGTAKYLFNTGKAWAPDTTSHVTPFSTQTTQALNGVTAAAKASQPALNTNFNRISATLADGGLNSIQDQQVKRLQDIASGNGLDRQQQTAFSRLTPMASGNGLNAEQQQAFNRLNPMANGNGMNAEQQAAYNRLTPMASGNGWNAAQQSGADFLKSIAAGGDQNGNPMLDEVIRRSSSDIANADNLRMSVGGRYGSGSHDNLLQKNIGDMSAGLRFTDYNTQQGRKDAAIRDYFGMGTTGAGQKNEAIGQMANLGTIGAGQKSGAINQMAGLGTTGAGQKSAAINQQFGMGTTGFGQRADAIGSLYNAGTAQRANILAGTQQLQDAYNARLDPWTTIGKVGGAYENKNQQILDDKSRVFNETKNAQTGPVNWLAQLANQFKGGNVTTSEPNNKALNALTGGMSGYDIFGGPIGAGVGALAGYLK